MKEIVEKKTLTINPPPQDKKCERCGRHVSELNPYGEAGDPLRGNFKGQLLVKTFRGMTDKPKSFYDKYPEQIEAQKNLELLCQEYENALSTSNIEDFDKTLKQIEEKLGKEKAESLWFYMQAKDTISPSWECRDCILE